MLIAKIWWLVFNNYSITGIVHKNLNVIHGTVIRCKQVLLQYWSQDFGFDAELLHEAKNFVRDIEDDFKR